MGHGLRPGLWDFMGLGSEPGLWDLPGQNSVLGTQSSWQAIMMTRRIKADMFKEADEVKSSEVITEQQLAGTPGLLMVYCCNLVSCWCISIVL